jgi:hypothetical protein
MFERHSLARIGPSSWYEEREDSLLALELRKTRYHAVFQTTFFVSQLLMEAIAPPILPKRIYCH